MTSQPTQRLYKFYPIHSRGRCLSHCSLRLFHQLVVMILNSCHSLITSGKHVPLLTQSHLHAIA
uniref:Uncharacterized protein n=1 Tax=Arundo donax TaxID=35708 RepID=A0A0A9DFA3_ARUDO